MKRLFLLSLILLLTFICDAEDRQKPAIELTRDNPPSLLSTNSQDYSVYGIRLGMMRDEAQEILNRLNILVGVQDFANPSRIYVYSRKPDGTKDKDVLYLIWEPNKERLREITVFQDFREHLTANFKRLLTFEALDDSSPFMKRFIGRPNRSKVTLDIPSIDLKNTTYYYNQIGLEVTRVHLAGKEHVVFALVENSPN